MAASRRQSALTLDELPQGAPAWFRYGVIAAATLVLCSCQATGPEYRVAHGAEVGGSFTQESSQATAPLERAPRPRASQVRTVSNELPTHLTPAQLAQATCLPEGFVPAPCDHSGCACCSNHGPIRGPNDEYLCDGGDMGLPAGVRSDWHVTGLEPEDTVAHYDTVDGRTIITPSNKVCIYAPRFAVVRQVIDPLAYAQMHAPEGAIQKISPVNVNEEEETSVTLAGIEPTIHRAGQPPSLLREQQKAGEVDRDEGLIEAVGAIKPYANVQLIRTGEVVGLDRVRIARSSLAAITWAGDQAAQVMFDAEQAEALVSEKSPGTIYHLLEPNNPKLRLCKLASTGAALPGEEVEFTLRFDNVGDRVIGNVTIVDHLTTRLEYVPESQKSTAKAAFSSQTNEGESLTLRWEIEEPLQPGKGGVIQFRTRVR